MDPSLFKIIKSGNIYQLKQIVSDHDLLQQVTPLCNTTLHVAVQYNKRVCVEEICRRCPSLLTQANSTKDTPLHIAAMLGLSDIASVLIKQSKTLNSDLESRAGGVSHIPALQQLVRMRNSENDTALHEAVQHHYFEVVKLLTEADPTFEYTQCNNDESSPLYLAAAKGFSNCVLQILQTCPSSEHRGPLGRTALHAAVICNRPDVTKLLLEKKSSMIKLIDDYGCSALHYAVCLGRKQMVVQLLDVDPSVAYMSNEDGKTALHITATRYEAEIIKQLIQHCPDCWELLDEEGKNFLHIAAENGEYKVIKDIIRHEKMIFANLINKMDNKGNTPLHLAILSESIHTLRILIGNKRVNVDAVNKDNLTAMDLVYNNLVNNRDASEFMLDAYGYLKDVHAKGCGQKHIIKALLKAKSDGSNKNNKDTDRYHLEAIEKRRQTNLLVAALIATVAFAAGFTLPGGYNSDGPHKGMAVLTSRPAFIAFLVSNTIAMVLSTFTVFIHFWGGHSYYTQEQKKWHTLSLSMEYRYTYLAIIAMVVAFMTGTNSVLHDAPRLATLILIIGCSFFFLCLHLFYRVYKLRGIKILFYVPPPKKVVHKKESFFKKLTRNNPGDSSE